MHILLRLLWLLSERVLIELGERVVDRRRPDLVVALHLVTILLALLRPLVNLTLRVRKHAVKILCVNFRRPVSRDNDAGLVLYEVIGDFLALGPLVKDHIRVLAPDLQVRLPLFHQRLRDHDQRVAHLFQLEQD